MGFKRELRLIGYSSGNLGKNLLWSAADLTLLYILTDILYLDPAFAGTAMLIAMAGDMAVDLGAGRLNAMLQARGIQYRHVLFILAPLCGAAFASLYILAAAPEPWLAGVLGALVAFRILYGLIDVPHNAMLPGIARGSHARGRIAGYRYFFSSVAALLVAGLLAPAVGAASATHDTADLGRFGTMAALLAVAALWLAALSDRWSPPRPLAGQSRRIIPHIGGDYARLLLLGLLTGGAAAMFGRTMIYYAAHVLHAPGTVGAILSAMVVGQFAGVGFWTLLSQRIETRTALAFAHVATALSVALFAVAGAEWPLACSAAVGFALAGVFMLPWALLANIIDADHAARGERLEPQAVSLFLVALKAGAAFGIAATGWALSLAGYRSGGDNVAAAVFLLTIAPPVVGCLAATWIASRLTGTHRTQSRNAAELYSRKPDQE